jgi:hypothetical protein
MVSSIFWNNFLPNICLIPVSSLCISFKTQLILTKSSLSSTSSLPCIHLYITVPGTVPGTVHTVWHGSATLEISIQSCSEVMFLARTWNRTPAGLGFEGWPVTPHHHPHPRHQSGGQSPRCGEEEVGRGWESGPPAHRKQEGRKPAWGWAAEGTVCAHWRGSKVAAPSASGQLKCGHFRNYKV